jgi:polyisoprenoid-binding protein YceI
MTLFFFELVFLFVSPAAMPAHSPRVECKVEFRVVNAGLVVTGSLEAVEADIEFNEKDLNKSRVAAKASARSINTGIAIRDNHLKRRDYFHTEKFESIELTSQSFRKVGRNRFEGRFMLTIKDITRELTIPFVVIRERNASVFTGSFIINRLQFALGEPSIILDDEVTISVHARVLKLEP